SLADARAGRRADERAGFAEHLPLGPIDRADHRRAVEEHVLDPHGDHTPLPPLGRPPARPLPFSRPLLNDASFSLRSRPEPMNNPTMPVSAGSAGPSTGRPATVGPTVSRAESVSCPSSPRTSPARWMLPFHC